MTLSQKAVRGGRLAITVESFLTISPPPLPIRNANVYLTDIFFFILITIYELCSVFY